MIYSTLGSFVFDNSTKAASQGVDMSQNMHLEVYELRRLHLLHARHCAKHFIALNSHNGPIKSVLFYPIH